MIEDILVAAIVTFAELEANVLNPEIPASVLTELIDPATTPISVSSPATVVTLAAIPLTVEISEAIPASAVMSVKVFVASNPVPALLNDKTLLGVGSGKYNGPVVENSDPVTVLPVVGLS